MTYYRSANRPQAYVPGPSPASQPYWRHAEGVPYRTQLSPVPARLSEENLARLDRGQARSSIFMSQAYGYNRAFSPFQPTSRYSISTSYPASRSSALYPSSHYSSDSRRTPTPSISPYSSPSAPPSRNHSPFPSPGPPPYISPNSKRYPDDHTPPPPRFSPMHDYPDPRPLVHRSPMYQQATHFNNGNNPYGRTRFPPGNVAGPFPPIQNPQYTPRGAYESDEEDSYSDESDDSEFSSLTGSSLSSSSELELFEEDSYDGDYEDASIYESPGDAATL
ncbi:uncharacterized protein EV420DRAFT_1640064 [Desarmillaria tabescens]|uniref:Uncharacterized protein n=1 Tax=Armillaria tabescens TaxID=1929756 RepID=A0AA39TWP6_ARMTA|nr:uncharacterized protein EV420DRAFT_1640064 [Desarmillaria tabescens]KAK0461760.1 hypothetical protein EV420DRAFT_1640064 [Desarmillaria tabescens]